MNAPLPVLPPVPEGLYRDYRGDLQLNGTLPWPERVRHLEYVDREGRVRDLYNINDYLDHPPRYFTTADAGVQTDLIADVTQHVLDNSDAFNKF